MTGRTTGLNKHEKEKAMTALRKVLVVDDDPVIGKSFDRVLSNKGYAVITARDGEEALAKLNAEHYDAVFTDTKMPGMDGLEVAERVRAKRPWTPVVIITGYGTADHEARAEAAGVREFLRKPLSPEMIEASARNAVAAPAPVAADTAAVLPMAEAVAIEAEALPAEGKAAVALKNVALFLASPFFGLAYIVAFPFVASAMLAWIALTAAVKYGLLSKLARMARHLGMLVLAPILGLAFMIGFPILGLAMLAWIGGAAVLRRTTTE